MCEIIFRGKEKNTKKWVHGGYASKSETTYAFAEDYEKKPVETKHYIVADEMTDWGLPNKLVCYEVIPETIGQYTGLKDKNGVKIFDGDICLFDPGKEERANFVVGWCEGGWMVEGNGQDDIDELDGFFCVRCEVIGNIHDNPELRFKEGST